MDRAKIEEAVRLFLEGIGEDAGREGLRDTPTRIALMCEEIFGGMGVDVSEHLSKTFSVADNEMVVERDIPFYSLCEHHLLPFYGKAHVAYVPNGKVLGLSKLARTVETFAQRAQIQEHMTVQVADAIMECLRPQGVMVVLEAEHMCMSMRGVRKPGTKTVSCVTRGSFEGNEELQAKFFQMLRMGAS